MRNNFVVFIPTYKRPNKILTLNTLRNAGYTGDIILVCSSDDPLLKQYQERYAQIVVFDKQVIKDQFDIGDNFQQNNVVVFARNAIWTIAKDLNKEYFLVLDDDYKEFNFRFNNKFQYCHRTIRKNLDEIFDLVIDYFKTIPALCIALAQGGDFIGGKESGLAQNIRIKRKIMNTFFCSTKRPFKFIGRINEDTCTYVRLGNTGQLVFQTNQLGIEQLATQNNSGGLTDFYLDTGTYVKSFYPIIFSPSCVKINLMGNKFKRLHHIVN